MKEIALHRDEEMECVCVFPWARSVTSTRVHPKQFLCRREHRLKEVYATPTSFTAARTTHQPPPRRQQHSRLLLDTFLNSHRINLVVVVDVVFGLGLTPSRRRNGLIGPCTL